MEGPAVSLPGDLGPPVIDFAAGSGGEVAPFSLPGFPAPRSPLSVGGTGEAFVPLPLGQS